MAVDIGPRIGIDGQAEYTKSLKNIIAQSKSLAAEMKAVTSAFDANDSSQKRLQSQMNVLSSQIETQQQRVKLLGDSYAASAKKSDELSAQLGKAVQDFGRTSTEAQKAAQALDRQEQSTAKAKAEYLNAQAALNKMNSEFTSLSGKVNQAKSPLENLTSVISSQEGELQQLKMQYANAVLEFGKGSSSAKRLASEIKDLSGDLNANKAKLKEAETGVDSLGDEFDDAGRQAASFGDIVGGSLLGNVLSDALSEIGSALSGLAGEAVSAADSLTKFESTMDFAGYDSKAIQEAEAAMQDYASRTVYDLETVSNTVAQLAANGVPDFERLTEAAGNLNAVAGGNADTFQSVAMVLTQTAGAGKLTTENWNQLADAIPGASGVLQQAMLDAGAYTGNFREAMEAGEISAEEFNNAIMQLGSSDAATQAAESVSTVEGAVGNLQATISDIMTSLLADGGTELITGFINSITAGFQRFGEWVAANKDQIIEFGQTAFNGIMAFGQFIIDNWEFIVTALSAIAGGIVAMQLVKFYTDITNVVNGVTTLSQTFPLLGNAISLLQNPVFLVGAAIVGLVTLFATKGDEIQDILDEVDDFMQNVFATDFTNIFGPVLGNVLNGFLAGAQGTFNSLLQILNGIIDFVRGVFTGNWQRAWQGVRDIFGGIFNGLIALVKAPVNAIIGILNGLIGGLNSMIDGLNRIQISIPDWVPGIGGNTFGINIGKIGNIPYLASGGIIRRGSAIVGEAGPELMSVMGNRTIVQPLTGANAVRAMGTEADDRRIVNAINAAAASIVRAVAENGGDLVVGDDVIYRSYNRARQSQAIVTGGAF